MSGGKVEYSAAQGGLIMCKAFYIKLLLKRLEDIMQAIWSMGGGNFAVSNKKALYKLPTHTRQVHLPTKEEIHTIYHTSKL